MDFVSDALLDGRRFRALTIVDNFSRESVAIEAGASMTAQRVVAILQRLAVAGRCPKYITVDNGSEFISKALDQWAHWRGVQLDFIRPGKPVENAYIESFNGKFRTECLSANWFKSMEEARHVIELWRQEYNGRRPHSSLGNLSPEEFLSKSMPIRLRPEEKILTL
jgi:putative transposase